MRRVSWSLIVAACAALGPAGCSSEATTPSLLAVVEGMQGPESAVFDSISRTWFISNTAGTAPGDGFVARADADGNVLAPRFAVGLDDPKGLAIIGRTLYAVDVARVDAIPIDAPGDVKAIAVPGARFLNDITADLATGDLYISDTFGNAVFRVHDGVTTTLIQDPKLESPNGLYVDTGGLWIASVGPNLDPKTFLPSEPGRILRFDLATGALSEHTARFGSLDGLVRDGTSFLASDFFRGVYLVDAAGTPTLILDNAATGWKSAADIGLDPINRRLAVPELFGTRVGLYALH